MKESLKIAREDLIDPWVAAFDEMGRYNQIKAQTKTIKYANI